MSNKFTCEQKELAEKFLKAALNYVKARDIEEFRKELEEILKESKKA